ncbi:MAG: isopeptide-forming domain-containing fimbrial protein, partial [bacterium]|nr:isopeptide-forming domain-containing fimbrial protein [bacterium]
EDSSITDNAWQDSADHDIGDKVPFQLTATLADNVSSYTTYKVVFHDTLSEGLTYNNDAKVTFNSTDVTSYFTINEENGSLTISCNNVKKFGATNNSVITVEYTATLNSNAVIGSAGNPNKVYLEYSNNPNKSAEGDNETGKTPEDTVIVFTYKTIINKVDGEDKALTGAAFKLEKKLSDNTWKLIKEFTVDEANPTSTFTFTGLDDGTYKLTETVTPASYNTIEPIEFTITASHDIESESPRLTELKVTSTADTERDPEEGEDAGTGKIKVPAFTTNTADGSLSANVINNKGAELPSTGGMGTTIFYVVGSILVLAAVVLLVTKKRMSGEK